MTAATERRAPDFVARVVSGRGFRATGVAHGGDPTAAWAVVDPRAHPLVVWRKRGRGVTAYGDTPLAMAPALFTNGPMMGKRFSSRAKLTRRRVAWEFAAATGTAVAAGLCVTPGRWRYALGGAGAALGSFRAWRRSFTGWTSCGHAVGARHGIQVRSSFDGEGARHSWLGRFGTDFASYAIGYGDLPAGVVEGLGGLILLVDDYAPVAKPRDALGPGSDLDELAHKRGIVAWGLVPLDVDSDPGLSGVVVVLGSRILDARAAAGRLAGIGARQAVGMDQSRCAMMGAGRTFLLGPPPPHRQAMQIYGLACA
jgi:hypothetical protein